MHGIPTDGSHWVSEDEEKKTSEKPASNVHIIEGEVDEQMGTFTTGL